MSQDQKMMKSNNAFTRVVNGNSERSHRIQYVTNSESISPIIPVPELTMGTVKVVTESNTSQNPICHIYVAYCHIIHDVTLSFITKSTCVHVS